MLVESPMKHLEEAAALDPPAGWPGWWPRPPVPDYSRTRSASPGSVVADIGPQVVTWHGGLARAVGPMHSPGAVGGAVGSVRVAGTVGRGPGLRAAGQGADWPRHPTRPRAQLIRRRPSVMAEFVSGTSHPGAVDGAAGSGRVRRRRGLLGSSMRWGGGQPAIGVAGQPPAALMDRPVMGPAHQRQVGQVGGAAMEPVDQMVGLAPGRGRSQPATAQPPSRTTRAARWAAETTRLARPPPAAGSGHPQGPGKPGRRRPEPGRQAAIAAGFVAGSCWPVGMEPSWWLVGWRLTRTRVTAPSRPAAGTPRGPAGRDRRSPPRPPGAKQAVQVHGHQQLGPHPTGPRQPAGFKLRRASSARASARRWLPLRSSSALAGRASGSNAASRLWPASGSSRPLTATMPSQVAASHNPAAGALFGPGRRCRGRRPAAAGDDPPQPGWVSRGPPPPAPVRRRRWWSGRSWVPAASTWAWAGRCPRRPGPGRCR